MKKYVGLLAMTVGLGMACSQQKPDFLFPFSPVSIKGDFAHTRAPGIWEAVPPGGSTYEGKVEYLVEALDKDNHVIDTHLGAFARQKPHIAGPNPTTSELVIILLATGGQMKKPVPEPWTANPRYDIPINAVAVRITADPKNRIIESNEKNNSYIMYLER